MIDEENIKIEKINSREIIRINHTTNNEDSNQGIFENVIQDDLNIFIKIQQNSWKSIFWFLLIITFPISLFYNFHSAYLMVSTKWSNKKTNRTKYLWCILTIFPLGCIGSLFFSLKGLKKLMFLEKK